MFIINSHINVIFFQETTRQSRDVPLVKYKIKLSNVEKYFKTKTRKTITMINKFLKLEKW